MSENSNWKWVKFSEVATIASNLVDPAEYPDLPHIAPNHIESGTGKLLPFQTVAEDGVTSSKHHFYPGQILYSKIRPYLAKAVVVDFEGLCSADMYPIETQLDTGFLHRWMLSPDFTKAASGQQGRTVLPKINQKALNKLLVPVPPPDIQEETTEFLEHALGQVRSLESSVTQLPDLIEKFRQSVLAAAFRGDLTKEWREQNPDVEPAGILLERIRAERRERWIEDEAEKGRAKAEAKARKAGKPWTEGDDQKALANERVKATKKYTEPEPVDTTALPELPDSWCWTRVELITELAGGLTKGKKRKSDKELREVPYLRVANVQRGYLDLEEIKTIEATEEEIQSLALQHGDVLFNEGGDIDKLGRGWVWQDELRTCIHQNHVFRARMIGDALHPMLLSHHGNSGFAQKYFLMSGKQTTNLASINMTKLRALPVPVPPVAEQAALLEVLNAVLASVAGVQAHATTCEARLTRLAQAVLAQAFSSYSGIPK